MHIEFTTKKKLAAVREQIRQLLLSDFPHEASRSALVSLQKFFDEQTSRVERASSATLLRTCITANERILEYLPVLGFLIRSTNVRNSFECYDGLLQIARSLIGPDSQIILSSEWDFSPLTYPMSFGALPRYVLLGMPSSEASNALVLPLAGHELGHSCWREEALEGKFSSQLESNALLYLKTNWNRFIQEFPEHSALQLSDQELNQNMFLVQVRALVVDVALSQVEEIFCDAVGTTLFGDSYLLAFHYLLAPSFGGDRPMTYPPLRLRASFMSQFSGQSPQKLGFKDFSSEFQDNLPNLPPRTNFVSKAADAIAHAMADKCFQEAQQVVQAKASNHLPSDAGTAEVLRTFRLGIPAHAPGSFADVINAGWRFVLEEHANFSEAERPLFEWISELMLKSIEVLEYRRRVEQC